MPVKKGKVNEKVSTKVLAALSTAFGREISFVDDLTYSEYSTELREAMMRVHPDTGGEYADEETFKILSIERDRIRGKNTEKELETFDREPSTKEPSVKVKKTKISPSKFFDKGGQKSPVQGKGGSIVKIGNSVTSIVETLKEDQKQDKKQQSWFRKMVERFKRRKKENKLEFKVLDGIKKTATKLLAPFKSAWTKLLDFIGKIILGRVLFKILTWMGNKKNQGKLKSIIKFFEDWWPVMLGAYLIFGNALTGFALGLLKNIVVWGAKLVATVIPALLKAAVAMGPWGLGAVAVLGGAAYFATKKNKTDQTVDQSVEDEGEEETGDQLREEKESKNMLERVGGFFTGEGQEREEQMQRVETGTEKRYGFFGELDRPAKTQNFKEGGLVQHYNNATEEASNIIQGFNEGGVVNTVDSSTEQAETKTPLDATEMLVNIINMNLLGLPGLGGGGGGTNAITDKAQTKSVGARTKDIGNLVARPFRKEKADPRSQFASGDDQPKEFKQGGFVSGPGGVDKVPARLTAGEFVMSKGAVQKYGANTLASMNAAGGGTNRPTVSHYYNSGGLVQNFNEGGKVGFFGGIGNIMGGKTWSGESRGQIGRGVSQANIVSGKTATVITPSEKKKVTVAYEEEKANSQNKPNIETPSDKVPEFSVMGARSIEKIELLGISV